MAPATDRLTNRSTMSKIPEEGGAQVVQPFFNPKDSGSTGDTQPESSPSKDTPMNLKNVPQFPVLNSPFKLFLQPAVDNSNQEDSPKRSIHLLHSPEIASPKDWVRMITPIPIRKEVTTKIFEDSPIKISTAAASRTKKNQGASRLMASKSHQIFDISFDKKEKETPRVTESQGTADFGEIQPSQRSNYYPATNRSTSNPPQDTLRLPTERYEEYGQINLKSSNLSFRTNQLEYKNNNWFTEPNFDPRQRSAQTPVAQYPPQTPSTVGPVYRPLFSFPSNPEFSFRPMGDPIPPMVTKSPLIQQSFGHQQPVLRSVSPPLVHNRSTSPSAVLGQPTFCVGNGVLLGSPTLDKRLDRPATRLVCTNSSRNAFDFN